MAALAESWNLWGWVMAGLILLAAELALPGIFLVWFGIAALATALVFALCGGWLGLQAQIIIFLIFAIAAVLAGRHYFARKKESDQPLLNETIAAFIGQNFTLAEPIIRGQGRLRVNDTIWQITGPDLPAGQIIRITGYHSGAFTAAPADKA